METKRKLQNETEAVHCDQCSSLAEIEVNDCAEVPSTDSNGWRMFVVTQVKRGCRNHPVVAMTTYLDGRVVPSLLCVPEKCQPENKS